MGGVGRFGRAWRGLARFGSVCDHMIVDGVAPRVRAPGRFWEFLIAMEVFKSSCLGTI